MSDIASPLARSKGEIVFLNADGAEVPAGSTDAVTVRTEGFELLRNGAFKIVSTFRHPNPPPPEKRRCRTRNGVLPAREPIPDAEQDAEIAEEDSERIEPGLDPPALAPNKSNPAAGERAGLGNVISLAADGFLNNPPRNSAQVQVLQARARHRPAIYAVRLSARRGDAPMGKPGPSGSLTTTSKNSSRTPRSWRRGDEYARSYPRPGGDCPDRNPASTGPANSLTHP